MARAAESMHVRTAVPPAATSQSSLGVAGGNIKKVCFRGTIVTMVL